MPSDLNAIYFLRRLLSEKYDVTIPRSEVRTSQSVATLIRNMAFRNMAFRNIAFRNMAFRNMAFRNMTFRNTTFRYMTFRNMTF